MIKRDILSLSSSKKEGTPSSIPKLPPHPLLASYRGKLADKDQGVKKPSGASPVEMQKKGEHKESEVDGG